MCAKELFVCSEFKGDDECCKKVESILRTRGDSVRKTKERNGMRLTLR